LLKNKYLGSKTFSQVEKKGRRLTLLVRLDEGKTTLSAMDTIQSPKWETGMFLGGYLARQHSP